METTKRAREEVRWEDMLFLLLISGAALLTRFYLFPIESNDYHQFLQKWFATLKENGGLAAIGMNIGDYMPPYFYILALLTYLPFNDLYLIKLVSCAADFVLDYYVMRAVSLRYPGRPQGFMAYAVVLFLPSVVLNSAAWAQCDAMYTAALLACLYYLLVNRPNRAVLAFSIAFVLKLQAIFFAPFLLLLVLKRKIKLRSLVLIPAVYILSIIPAAIMGRSLWDLLTVYVSQSKLYTSLCMSIPNLYAFLGNVASEPLGDAGVIFAGGAVLMLLYALYRKEYTITPDILVTIGLLFAILMPFILPHMHERYYFLADIVSVVFAFYFPKKLYAAVIMCVSSACATANYLFGLVYYPQQLLAVAILINLVLLMKHLWELLSQNPIQRRVEAAV